MRIFVAIALLVTISVSVGSQQSSSQTRTQEIAASFNKFKNAVKEKNGVRTEKYKDVRSEPVVKQNKSEYSGVYEAADLGYTIAIQIENDGRVKGSGYERAVQWESFTLENASIEGALLRATKIYDNGAAENFEAVFMSRTERNSPTAQGVTTFGLGVQLRRPFERNGVTYDRLFYVKK